MAGGVLCSEPIVNVLFSVQDVNIRNAADAVMQNRLLAVMAVGLFVRGNLRESRIIKR